MRYLFSEGLWADFEPLVRQSKGTTRGPKPKVPDRMFLEALLYLSRTGIPWRDRPSAFGRWEAIYNRFRRGVASGGLRRLFELRTAPPQLGDLRRVLIDPTIVRAHPHATGARRKKRRPGPSGRRRTKPPAAAAGA